MTPVEHAREALSTAWQRLNEELFKELTEHGVSSRAGRLQDRRNQVEGLIGRLTDEMEAE